MIGALFNVLAALLLMLAVSLFFVGFVLAPLAILAIGYVVLQLTAPDN